MVVDDKKTADDCGWIAEKARIEKSDNIAILHLAK